MLRVDLWVDGSRRHLDFFTWARLANLDITSIVEYHLRVRDMWKASESELPVREWATAQGHVY